MQMYYLLLFSDWFSGDEKIPQSLYGLRKLGISCMGYGKPWKMTKKLLVCEQKSYKYFKIGMIGIFPCNSLRVLVVLWEGTA